MTNYSKLFSTYSPCACHKKVKIADGTFSTIASVGSIPVSKTLTLHNVLNVLNLSCNLLSISKLTQDLNCLAIFYSSTCKFQELSSGRMIGSSKEVDGLYLFEDEYGPKEKLQKNCLNSILIREDQEIMLWHYRLGHPNFLYSKHLFPDFFKNKNPNLFSCEIFQFAKHHRSSYSPKDCKQSSLFTLIHSDVWGPCREPTPNGKRWFITFIDDHTWITWVYLMKTRYEVESIFQTFFQMIQTQFQMKIKVFRSENGREYFNKHLSNFFLENGTIHQSSCVDTPQQNGVAERKNRHLLEVARALFFQNKAPKYLWGETILTGTYLINRMPSKIFNFKTPLDVFTSAFPNNRLSCTLPLKIFGCTVFVHIHEPNQGKLEPRACRSKDFDVLMMQCDHALLKFNSGQESKKFKIHHQENL